MDEGELRTARDGAEHLSTSEASRRLTALSSAAPRELSSHVQVHIYHTCASLSCVVLSCLVLSGPCVFLFLFCKALLWRLVVCTYKPTCKWKQQCVDVVCRLPALPATLLALVVRLFFFFLVAWWVGGCARRVAGLGGACCASPPLCLPGHAMQ